MGDIFYGPLEPRRTERLLANIDALTIQGNQDRQLYSASPGDAASSPTLRHVLAELGDETVKSLRKLPPTLTLENRLFACHGSPQSDQEYLIEDVSKSHPRVRPEAILEMMVQQANTGVVVCGHSHIPRSVRLRNGTLIVNPGSVGLPAYSDESPNQHQMETCSPNASYAVLSSHGNEWCVELYSVPYDFNCAVAKALALGRTDWASWLSSGRASG